MQDHDHLCQVVADREDLVEAIARFLEGLGPRQGIFIHRYTDGEAWDLLEEGGPAQRLKDQGLLQAVTREEAFQGGSPRIHYGHVGETVTGALAAAQSGDRGLAILADASHAYIDEGRASEWFAFENWLGRRLGHEVRLVCLYWQEDLEDPAHLEGMMKTHLARLEAGGTWSTQRAAEAGEA